MIKQSSLTKKYIMAFAGIFLALFLLVHLGINLFILPIAENHQEVYENAVHFMTSNPLVRIFEVVLFATFLIHIVYGTILQIQNWRARPQRYRREGWAHTSFFSKFMIHTGIIIFIFLVIHFINFYFVKLGITSPPRGQAPVMGEEDFYPMAVNLFSNAPYAILYIVLLILLGFHLNHAFQSAFQSLGLNHSKYTPVIRWIGTLYSIIVPLGFICIPLYFLVF
ncbi:MAG TPA: succinate dehydrogenase cytochrome b subunit [Bacteroidales bacterium]|nr:succinate dehydrogenase cytochrome b subunit [Bacteroidales bacterium]HNS45862.1 succinate dehydrogenase cytochrome b subunit [Bacteroidales bacterium]